ncbi:hypothetical protein [Microbacterium aureliae]
MSITGATSGAGDSSKAVPVCAVSDTSKAVPLSTAGVIPAAEVTAAADFARRRSSAREGWTGVAGASIAVFVPPAVAGTDAVAVR